jgi:hypothetical protein
MKRVMQFLILAACLLIGGLAQAAPQGTTFTYQGRLEQSGAPVTGNFDFTFKLFDAIAGGTQVGATVTRAATPVENGLFTVALDFGIAAYNGNKRFIQVQVGTTTLSPRTELTSSPYANAALTSLDSGMAQSVAYHGATNNLIVPDTEVGTGVTATGFSVAIGADGLPIVSYYAVPALDLKVALCHDTICSSASTVTIDSGGDVGDFNAIAIGSDERPVISYYDRTNGDLKFARCADPQCTSAVTSTLDTLGDTGQWTSITAMNGTVSGIEGNKNGPLIAYYDATNKDLRYIRCDDADCATPTGTALDTVGDVGQFTSIAFDGNRVQIAYQDVTNKRLKLAACSTAMCTTTVLRTLDSTANSGFAPSIALTASGRALVVHDRFDSTDNSNDIALVRCNAGTSLATYCDTPVVVPILGNFSTGQRTPQLLLRNGNSPLIWDGQFSMAACEDVNCAALSARYSATGINTTQITSRSAATIGADGLPLLIVLGGSLDGTPRGLKADHCANPGCRSYGRDR